MTVYFPTAVAYHYIHNFPIDNPDAETIKQITLGTVLVVNLVFYMWTLSACIKGMKILLVEK